MECQSSSKKSTYEDISENSSSKYHHIETKPNLKDSSKQVKAALMRYNQSDKVYISQVDKNLKNLSYCSNDADKSINTKKRYSVSEIEDSIKSSAKRKSKIKNVAREKMKSISSASSIKSIPYIKKSSSDIYNTPCNARKELEISNPDHLEELKQSILEADKKIEENKHPNNMQVPAHHSNHGSSGSKGIANETLSSIYSIVEENSVWNKRHDISVVEADGILEQINSRMMKLHFEMIYKNLDKNDGKIDDFSFEIDNTNNMIVPKNSKDPIKIKKFVQLPHNEDLYKETERSDGRLQWIADTQTIRIFSQSPKREKEGVCSPFTSPMSHSRSSMKDITSPGSSTKPSMSHKRAKRSMYQNEWSTENFYNNNVYYNKNDVVVSLISYDEIKDHEDQTKDKNDDIEIERELEFSQKFVNMNNPNNSMQGEKSFDSRISNDTESINTNNYSFLSYGKNFYKLHHFNFFI